jgi:hypothetical protein
MDEVTIYDDATWGKHGKDIIPSPIYQVYRVKGAWNSDDESIWYSFDLSEGLEPSEIAIVDLEDETKTYTKIEANKYGYTDDKEMVKVTITASESLAELYPAALVNIDGKLFDLNYLNNPIEFYMDKNHRVSIEWSDDLTETFRIVKLA